MAPPSAAKAEREKKVQDILTFASKIPNLITTRTIDPSLGPELRSRIHRLPLTTTSSRMQELDARGTELWNLATRLSREPKADEYKLTLCLLRVFAFFLLDSGHSERVGSRSNCVRLLKVAFKSAKVCLALREVEFCVKVLERAACYVDAVGRGEGEVSDEEREVGERLRAEYFVVRTTLAWKQSKLDVAEHMFKKAEAVHHLFRSDACEEFADTLYEIGKDLVSGKQHELAAKWLGRALDVLSERDLEHLSDDASELKMAAMHLCVKSLLAMCTDEAKKSAADLVGLMEKDYGEKMVVSLLKLELLSSGQSPDPEAYFTVLMRMIRSIVLTRENFKTLMHHLHKLRKLSPKLTCKALDELLAFRLVENGKEEWIECATIMRIWITTSQGKRSSDEAINELTEVLDCVKRSIKNPFNGPAAHAAQTLIWKHIEAAIEGNQHDDAQRWCQLALHPVFEKCGEFNRSKLHRKIIICALADGNFAIARQAFFSIPESGQKAPETQYLMYKLALRSGDGELAASSLEAVCKSSDKDVTLLYACVLEAMQSGEKQQAVAALKKVLEKYDYDAPKGVHLPALLRCVIRLLKGELDAADAREEIRPRDMLILELRRAFEAAAKHAKNYSEKHKGFDGHDFSRPECEWFYRSSYNLVMSRVNRCDPSQLSYLCKPVGELLDILLQYVPSQEEGNASAFRYDQLELQQRYITIEYLAVLGLTDCARRAIVTSASTNPSLKGYLDVRLHGEKLRALILAVKDQVKGHSRETLLRQYFETLTYELEATLHLKQWDDLSFLFNLCLSSDLLKESGQSFWRQYADLAILINEELVKAGPGPVSRHQPKVISFLQSLISETCRHSNSTNDLCKWNRVVFQMCLKSDEKMALQWVDRAIQIAQAGKGRGKDKYDPTELEWLAGSVFNKAMDFCSAGDENSCRAWAEKAMSLAGEASDGGAYLKVLRENYSTLAWERED